MLWRLCGPMTRAYIRISPEFYERKVFEDGYPLPAVGAFMGCLCLGEMQPTRGRFRDLTVLRALLGPAAKWVKYLIDHEDLIVQPNGSIYIDGWDEWQEGDVTVKERMQRIRNRKANRNQPVLAESGAGRNGGAGQPARFADAYKAFAQLQGHKPDVAEKRWMDDLSKDFTCEVVARSLYDDEAPSSPGLLGRVSKTLRRKAA